MWGKENRHWGLAVTVKLSSKRAHCRDGVPVTQRNRVKMFKSWVGVPGTHTWPREVWVLPARWNVAVETDNSPLEQIFKKNINEAPSWLQRLLLRRLRFDVNVQYKQGRSIPVADALSRVCHGIAAPTTKSMTEDYVSQRNIHFISTRIDLKAGKSSMVLDTTENLLKNTIFNGWPP